MVYGLRSISKIYLLTVYDCPHTLEETVNNLERLRGRRPSFFLSKSI
jgi:hypothetical protein